MNASEERTGRGPRDENGHGEDKTSPLEWAVAALGLLLVLACVGFLLVQALSGPTGPPDVVLEAGEVHETRGGFLVEVRARNEGGATAAGLRVTGSLGGGLETSETTLDYLPPYSAREGGLFFTRDPREHGLVLRAEGFETP